MVRFWALYEAGTPVVLVAVVVDDVTYKDRQARIQYGWKG